MIINSIDKQILLAENGEILWQKDLTNPRPGEPIAQIVKGDALHLPKCKLIEGELLEGQDIDAVLSFTQGWLERHIKTVLEPLFKLLDDDIADGAPKQIGEKLFEAMGILPREELATLIQEMSEEGRNSLRSKKIRFGPVIVYLPELNKPAAVRLRALLLSLWDEKELPADVPADGIVSMTIDELSIDKQYYRAIGYPVYGSRACRVDMLDRVICAVYDSADKGKFQAQHQMAEWLGCSIPDLYLILEAMGHRKVFDPADQVEDTSGVDGETKTDEALIASALAPDANSDEEKKPVEQVKPELATFILKKGGGAKKSSQQKPSQNKFEGKSFSSKKGKKLKGKKPHSNQPRVYKAEAENDPADNPFAILEQLKKAGKE